MIRQIFSTTAARFTIALINLGIVWISARSLGAEGMGTVSLLILGVSILQMISAMLGGSALVYQVPRHPLIQLMAPSWVWATIVSVAGSLLLKALGLIPAGLTAALAAISILQAMFAINQNVQLGRERVMAYNMAAVFQSSVMFGTLLLLYYAAGWKEVGAYVTAMMVSLGLAVPLSFSGHMRVLFRGTVWKASVVRETLKFGGYIQTASFMQLFNYRLGYYIIEKYFDRATLGVFSIGVQIAESVWIISKSIALVQYSRISNAPDPEYSRRITIDFIKFTGIFTVLMTAVLLLLPPAFFELVFRSGFSRTGEVILSLAPGIVAVAVSLMFSHYFSGSGKPWHNTISSAIGLVFTVVLGFSLIPAFGLTGAGITASAAYLAGTIYQMVAFSRLTGTRLREYIPGRRDAGRIRSMALSLIRQRLS